MYNLLKKIFFYSVMILIVLGLFEVLLVLGGFFYFDVYSNMDHPEVEDNAFRILFLGESTTAGWGTVNNTGSVIKSNAYPAQVEEILQQKYPDIKIKAYNKGVSAIETTGILRNLDKNMIKYKPNLVVINAGGNGGFSYDSNIEKKASFKIFFAKSRIYRLVASVVDNIRVGMQIVKQDGEELRYHKSKYFKISEDPSNPVSNFETILKTVRSYNSEIYFAGYLQPNFRDVINPNLRRFTEEHNVTFIENYPYVDFIVNSSLFGDGWHPSKEGHKIIAEKIAEKIVEEKIIDLWKETNNKQQRGAN